MTPFYALLGYVALRELGGAILTWNGHRTLQLRRRPEPRKPTAPGES